MKNKAFTLLELLVVVFILVILIAILLPALNLAREHARIVVCSTNLYSIGTYHEIYQNDEGVPFYKDGFFSAGYVRLQKKYKIPLNIFDCPGTKICPDFFIFSDYETFLHKIYIDKTSIPLYEFPALWDNCYTAQILSENNEWFSIFYFKLSENHGFRATNILYLDSHVKTLKKIKD